MFPQKLEAGLVVIKCDFVPRRCRVAACAIVIWQKLFSQFGPVYVLVTINALCSEILEVPGVGTEVA